MNKKIFISLSFILIIIVATSSLYNANSNKNQKKDNYTLAIDINDESANEIPQKGLYKVETECDNAIGKWNYDDWNLEISNIGENALCHVTFRELDEDSFLDYILSLTDTMQGNGMLKKESLLIDESNYDIGVRYEGKNPNNYVKFNNELWRIIGIFDEKEHGIEGKKLIKILKNDALGSISYRLSAYQLYKETPLYKLLNNNYYNQSSGSGTCQLYGAEKNKCDFTSIGLNDYYRGMVESVYWHLGGVDSRLSNYTAATFYKAERNLVENENSYKEKIFANIGLIYVSDYGFANLSSSCSRDTLLSKYNTKNCAGNNWMFRYGDLITLTEYTGATYYGNITINSDGSADGDAYIVRPTLYLSDTVKLLDGNGTYENPYIISL